MKLHRNSQKRIIFEDACYFVTSKTYNNYPFFREQLYCDLFVKNLRLCKQLKGFMLYGWVLNYDHFHLLAQPNDEYDISKVMFSIKKQFSHDVNRIIDLNQPYPHLKADKRLSAFRNGGLSKKSQRTIVEYQKYVNQLYSQIQQIYPINNPYPKFHWQQSFYDHYIRNEAEFNDTLEYIAHNTDKHELATDWPYTFINQKYANLCDIS